MERRKAKLSEICKLMGVQYKGEDVVINALNLCNRPTQYEAILGYTTSEKFFDAIFNNPAVKGLVVSEGVMEKLDVLAAEKKRSFTYIISDEPEALFYDIHNKLWNETIFYDHYDWQPVIGERCKIHSTAVIENGVVIGDDVTIGPNSVVRSNSKIGNGVKIGCCTVIGSEGFQAIKGYNKPIKHIGGTIIEDDVFICDNVTIGNAIFEGNTIIGEKTMINNHCHIAHNCRTGKRCVITACCIMMGSTALEDDVWLAPNSVVRNGRTVKTGATVGTMAFVNSDVEAGTTVVGIPAKPLIKHN